MSTTSIGKTISFHKSKNNVKNLDIYINQSRPTIKINGNISISSNIKFPPLCVKVESENETYYLNTGLSFLKITLYLYIKKYIVKDEYKMRVKEIQFDTIIESNDNNQTIIIPFSYVFKNINKCTESDIDNNSIKVGVALKSITDQCGNEYICSINNTLINLNVDIPVSPTNICQSCS